MTANTIGVLERDVAFYARLSAGDRERLVEKVTRFVRAKEIRGASGAFVDERVRVLVAAAACRLSLNLIAEDYRRLKSVDVFPTTIDREHGASLGLAFQAYGVWLALDALEHGLRHGRDGDNVGYHEFAHVLDASDGIFDGVPPLLLEPRLRTRWVRVMGRELVTLRELHKRGAEDLLPPEACENEAELFAYATEAFFERPELLREARPQLFELLAAFYRQDPAVSHAH